jgi:ketosteroid isomerase-like protein
MYKFFLCVFFAAFLTSCNNDKNNEKTAATSSSSDSSKPVVDLPYKASYSASFTTDVSDADLKLVLTSYKDWSDGDMTKVATDYGDSLSWDRSTGDHFKLPNAGIMKMWKSFRDSLSSVTIDMQAWQKMYASDKKEGYVVTWYKEIDTYKGGKADSGYYHDINQVKDGKIIALEQYKRPAK